MRRPEIVGENVTSANLRFPIRGMIVTNLALRTVLGKRITEKNCTLAGFRLAVSAEEVRGPAADPEIRPPYGSRRKMAYSPSVHNGTERRWCVRRGHTPD